jgi:hypothetical protein
LLPAERLRAEPGSGPSQAELEAAAEAAELAAAIAAAERAEREERLTRDKEAALSGVGASPLYGALGGVNSQAIAGLLVVSGSIWRDCS